MKHAIAKKIFKQVYLGVKYIHSYNIAHRDIKIENILFDSNDGKIKIIDFSISTIVKSENKLINEPGGSMHYQSPEFFDTDNNGYYNSKENTVKLTKNKSNFIYKDFDILVNKTSEGFQYLLNYSKDYK